MRKFNLLVSVILVLLVLARVIPPAIPTRTQTGSPPGSLVEIVFPDDADAPAQAGVYLGHGLILTNWHPWTLDGQVHTDKERAFSASWQVAHYDDDGVSDPGEWVLDRITRIPGAGFMLPGDDVVIPAERLIYADRATDIALFAVDAAAAEKLEAQGAVPARLSLADLSADSPVRVSGWSEQGAESLAAVLSSDRPELLPISEDRRLDGPWRVWSLRLSAPDTVPNMVPDGSPVFDPATGDLVGLVWRAEGVTPGAYWLTPTSVWLHDLYAANESIQSANLAVVLQDVALTPVYGDLTLNDPLTPELGNAGIDVLHVALDLAFDLDAQTLAGTAALDIRATAHGLIAFGLDAEGLDVTRVTVDGIETPFAVKTDKLLIELAEPVAFGTTFRVEIGYSAAPMPFRSPYMPGFDIGMFWGDATVSTLDQPDGAHTWFPINDHPSDRATYDVRLRVPEPLTAVTNGELVKTITNDDETHTFVWRMAQPMASYLTVIAVADYVALDDQAADGTPVTHYVYADQAEAGRDLFGYTDDALVMLETWFGPYPYDRYGHVVAPVQGMALETQTMTTLPDLVLDWTELEIYELMVHELAHQWFGNTVTPRVWSDIWLNEGFARYAQWLARDARFGAEAGLAARSSSEQRMIAETRRTPLIDPDPAETFGTATYDKGGWVLHMLRGEIGDAAFFDLLQTWAVTFADRPATTLDFWQLAEQISDQDLAWFFEQWTLQADDMPDLRLYWTETDSGADVLLCPAEIEYYTLDVPVRFVGDEYAQLDTVIELRDIKGASAQIALDFVPREVIADADQAVLAQIAVQPIDVLPGDCWGGM